MPANRDMGGLLFAGSCGVRGRAPQLGNDLPPRNDRSVEHTALYERMGGEFLGARRKIGTGDERGACSAIRTTAKLCATSETGIFVRAPVAISRRWAAREQ